MKEILNIEIQIHFWEKMCGAAFVRVRAHWCRGLYYPSSLVSGRVVAGVIGTAAKSLVKTDQSLNCLLAFQPPVSPPPAPAVNGSPCHFTQVPRGILLFCLALSQLNPSPPSRDLYSSSRPFTERERREKREGHRSRITEQVPLN